MKIRSLYNKEDREYYLSKYKYLVEPPKDWVGKRNELVYVFSTASGNYMQGRIISIIDSTMHTAYRVKVKNGIWEVDSLWVIPMPIVLDFSQGI